MLLLSRLPAFLSSDSGIQFFILSLNSSTLATLLYHLRASHHHHPEQRPDRRRPLAPLPSLRLQASFVLATKDVSTAPSPFPFALTNRWQPTTSSENRLTRPSKSKPSYSRLRTATATFSSSITSHELLRNRLADYPTAHTFRHGFASGQLGHRQRRHQRSRQQRSADRRRFGSPTNPNAPTSPSASSSPIQLQSKVRGASFFSQRERENQ